MNSSSEFARLLHTALDLECRGAIAGAGTGTVVSLHFGPLVKRAQPIKHRQDVLADHEGSTIFLIECTWTLFEAGEILCSCSDSNAADGAMLAGLGRLTGKHLIGLSSSSEALFDLCLHFESNITLEILCDSEDEVDNYSIFLGGAAYTVNSGHELEVEPASADAISP